MAEATPSPESGYPDSAPPPEAGPGVDAIVAAVREAAAIPPGETLALRPLASNPERRDFHTRLPYLALRGGRSWGFLTVGLELDDTWRRTCAFAQACPQLACAPLFRHSIGSWTLTAVEYFDGASIEDALREGTVSVSDAERAIDGVHRTLDATREVSDVAAATIEYDAFAARVLAIPALNAIDRTLLAELVLPAVRAHALRGAQETRWSNGDFVARNLLVAPDGRFRLIDFEFASRTHFFAVDRWRWRSFSKLPAPLQVSPALGPESEPHWVEAFGILQQLLYAHETQGSAAVEIEARARVPDLLRAVTAGDARLQQSLLWRTVTPATPPPVACRRGGLVTAQLFWNATGAFNEHQSRHLCYEADTEATLTWIVPAADPTLHLRLDPAEAPGLLRLSRLRVSRLDNGMQTTLVDLEHSGWHAVTVLGGAMRLGEVGALHLLSLGDDPCLRLPPVNSGPTPCDLLVEVQLRFESRLDRLPAFVAPRCSP